MTLAQAANVGVYTLNDLHLFFTTGYILDLNNDLKLKPSILVKSVSGAPISFDVNSNLWIKDMLGIGLSYRIGSAFVSMFELQLNSNLRFGYAYDLSLGSLGPYNQGSHEFLVRYEFGKGIISNSISSRYF